MGKFQKIWNIIWCILVAVWLAGAFYLHSVVKADEAKIRTRQEEQTRKEARARRAATYERSQTQSGQNTVRNAVDSLNRERR